MKRKPWLALLLALTMILTMMPAAEAEPEPSPADTPVVQAAAPNWLPAATKTASGDSDFPLTLNDGDVLRLNGPIDYTAPTGKSPIEIAAGAKVTLIINGSVALHGANADGTAGATAAIHVPATATLTIYSAHDEELSTSTEAPKDTLTVTGGSAAIGANGGDGVRRYDPDDPDIPRSYAYSWYTGSGGNGGGGAAAAIGGNGGNGGNGGKGSQTHGKSDFIYVTRYILTDMIGWFGGIDDRPGVDGNSGYAGSSGETAGSIRILGRLTLNATGGSAASGGKGGIGSGGFSTTSGDDRMIGGTGGGGGGGGGCAAPAIGAGGSGGSGGGSGGHPSSDEQGNVQGCGGGGGGGGWPNGGGGGGGGSECSGALDDKDNTSSGGFGGDNGKAGETGRPGGDGHSTGTDGHGKDKDTGVYDAAPGEGGYGGGGVKGSGGRGGPGGADNKKDYYNGGDGGDGGNPVPGTAWYSDTLDTRPLLLSTACNLTLSGYDGHDYGGGQGSGTVIGNYATQMVYDLMDCAITFKKEYTYSGEQITPLASDLTVTYSAASDRDGALVCSMSETSTISRYTLAYGENIHCPTGTLTATGTTESPAVAAHASVVGSKTQDFTIKKATITKVTARITDSDNNDATYDATTPLPFPENRTQSEEAYIRLDSAFSWSGGAGAKPGDFDNLLLTNPVDPDTSPWWVKWPTTTWTTDNYSEVELQRLPNYPGVYKFHSTCGGTFDPQITLSGMNDFEDYTCALSVLAATITVDKPNFPLTWMHDVHPRKTAWVEFSVDNIDTILDYEWLLDDSSVALGATASTYTVKNSDVGKTLSVYIVLDDSSPYKNIDDPVTWAEVEAHSFSNGFCPVCGEYEQPAEVDGVYQIDNGGKLFWFAAYVNGDDTHAEAATAPHASAKAVLTADVSLQNPADTRAGKRTEWTPIGVASGDGAGANDTRFTGTFDGNGHTISGLSITTVAARTGLFAAIDAGAAVKNFTISGDIALTNGNSGGNAGVGGVVGCAFGGTVSGVTSKVNISNPGGEALSHVGGVIGGTNNGGVLITKCVYEVGSSINVTNSADCIGGVVGYAIGNNKNSQKATTISYCANRGSVDAAAENAYTGGILGYVDNTNVYVKNCYNYGTVANGGGNFGGAIVGRLMKDPTDLTGKLTDNYYLEGSAPAGFGSGSQGTGVTAEARTSAAFASGEVCYLVNGKVTLAADDAVWMQNVDNDKPHTPYPVFDAAPVYFRSDHTYSNSPENINVTITWGSMDFTCTGTWNPVTHTTSLAWTPTDADGSKLTVKNNSNVSVNTACAFTRETSMEDCNLTGTFSTYENPLAPGVSRDITLSLSSKSAPTALTEQAKKIGSVTVTVSALYQG